MSRYHVIACDVLREEFIHYAAQVGNEVSFDFLEQCLHNEPERLRACVRDAIERSDPTCDAVLLGYGLCSNGLHAVAAGPVQLVIPRAHDCITLFLGSKERYAQYFAEHPGTYWYTPGWIGVGTQPSEERFAQIRSDYAERYGEENADYLMEMEHYSWIRNYNNAAYVDLGIGETERHREFTRNCARFFGWQCDFLEGDPRLFIAMLSGEWDPDEFIVVPPGMVVVASYDDGVFDTRS